MIQGIALGFFCVIGIITSGYLLIRLIGWYCDKLTQFDQHEYKIGRLMEFKEEQRDKYYRQNDKIDDLKKTVNHLLKIESEKIK